MYNLCLGVQTRLYLHSAAKWYDFSFTAAATTPNSCSGGCYDSARPMCCLSSAPSLAKHRINPPLGKRATRLVFYARRFYLLRCEVPISRFALRYSHKLSWILLLLEVTCLKVNTVLIVPTPSCAITKLHLYNIWFVHNELHTNGC